ncbi:MAG: hypothetical protein HC904_08995 [Blastochloris sp.]|nr:hypothetical protein [Blastochloris sp.]
MLQVTGVGYSSFQHLEIDIRAFDYRCWAETHPLDAVVNQSSHLIELLALGLNISRDPG